MDGSLERFSREQLLDRVRELEEHVRKVDALATEYMLELSVIQVKDMMERGGRTR